MGGESKGIQTKHEPGKLASTVKKSKLEGKKGG